MEGIFVTERIRRTKYWPRMTDFPSQIGRNGSEITTSQSHSRLFTLRNSDIDMITHASLFSGIGGAELAASWIGWTNLFHCEINEFSRKVLEYWFPQSISYEDITKADFSKWRGRVDVLTGGFPCQPFSVAGKRKGAEDNRYLWAEMLRAIRQIQPTWVVGENVAGLLSMVQPGKEIKMGRTDDLFKENFIYRAEQQFTIDAICEDLERAHYSVQPLVIPACAVGAPHRRDRVWIVAHRTDAGVEILQQGEQNGVCEFITTSDTCNYRQRHGKGEQIFGREHTGTSNTCNGRKVKYSPHADRIGRDEMGINLQCKIAEGKGVDCNGTFRTSSNSKSARSPRQLCTKQRQEKSVGQNCGIYKPDFINFPTQSPICRGDDGLPFRVADLTISFPRWRRKSIEALGNAWVPQVAYEIFKTINNYEKRD